MDLEMPDMDGHEATLAIRQDLRFNQLPIIAMTAHALATIRERCLNEGMQDYVTKPINPEQLYNTLSRWLVKSMTDDAPLPASGNKSSAVPQLAGIDTALGLSNVRGNSALYLKLLDRFRSSQRLAVADVRKSIAGGQRPNATLRAHTLRGVAANIGALAIHQAAEKVELYLEDPANKNLADPLLAQHLKTLDDALSAALAGLDAHFANTDADAGPAAAPAAASTEATKAALMQLNTLLDAFSGKSLAYFDSVKPSLAQLLDEATLERLSAHIRRFEFDEARQLLASVA
jgi:CheY-like chemotaxis protein